MNETSIFLEAVEKVSPEERDAFLAQACAGNDELRANLEMLLKAHAKAGDFLVRSPAAELAPTLDEPTERPGTIIGQYKLMEEIGSGGFGVVFVAEQQHPVRRKVAVKVIKPGMDTRELIARFEAERQALALMDHPNIARVFEGGASPSGRPYFVMELVRGMPITHYCDQHQLPLRQRLALLINVCQAVQHAHQKGIIHRDLKPSNIMVSLHDATPVVKVIDFGVAKAIGQQLTEKTIYTRFTQMIGTPVYMSPEQAGMSGLDVDTRTDIYALGVLLYELLTGTTPFDKERLRTADYEEIRRIIREEDPPRPSTRFTTLGPAANTVSANRKSDVQHLSRLVRGELDWIVMKALEKDRNRRYETAGAFAADVERYLNDEPVQACPPSRWYRFGKFARRNKAVLTTGMAVAVALVIALASLIGAVTVLAGVNAQSKLEQEQTKEALHRETQAKLMLTEALAGEQRIQYFQRLGLAQRDLANNNIGSAEELLHECPPELRGWEWHLLKRQPYETPLVVVPFGPGWVMHMAASADGRYLATAGWNLKMQGQVKVWDAATGKELHTLAGHPGAVTGLAFHPSENQLATAGTEGKIFLWNPATGRLLRSIQGHNEPIIGLCYRYDGKRLASASLDRTVRVWDLATEVEAVRFSGHGTEALCVAYSRDGKRIASWGMDACIRVWDADTGQEQLRLTGHWHRVMSLLFDKEGRHLVSAGSDGRRIWDLQTGRLEQTFKGTNSAAFMAAFSPDGRRLAFAGLDNTVQVWDWPSGQEVLALRGHNAPVTAVTFSGDGHRLFSASPDGTLRVWNGTPLDVAPLGNAAQGQGKAQHTLQGHEGSIVALAFSPDQRYLATGALDGTARLWDVGARKLLHTLPGQDISSVAFHDGGRRLTTVATDGTLVQWDPATGERQRTLSAHLGPIWNATFSAGFSADGERLTSLSKDGVVRVWETESGREIVSAPVGTAVPITAFLSPDGKRVAVAGFGSISVVDVESKKPVAGWSIDFLHSPHHIVISADGRRLAAAGYDGTVRVWDIKSTKLLHTFHHDDRVICVAFHPNGNQLASGSSDNTAKVWDLESGKEIETLRGHIGYVMALAYSGDGRLLATASGHRYAGEVQLWETADFGKKR